jgi:LmbE family N-acetylglucosaminyl deacetylase
VKEPLLRLLRSVLRSAYTRTLPGTVRDAIRLQRELARRDLNPSLSGPPAVRRIVVLAPHMDDEVFGCGGTLARAVASGSEVRVLFITDGSRGYDPARASGLSQSARLEFERTLVVARKAEARHAAAILRLGEPVFLDLPDGRAGATPGAAERLACALRQLAPEALFVPFFTDPHPDHWATNRLLVDALAGSRLPLWTLCWAYEVWTPLFANTFVDVSQVMETKSQAMAAFSSQLRDVDYARAISALNAYRCLAAGVHGGYAEAFFVETLGEYCRIFGEVLRGRSRVFRTAGFPRTS